MEQLLLLCTDCLIPFSFLYSSLLASLHSYPLLIPPLPLLRVKSHDSDSHCAPPSIQTRQVDTHCGDPESTQKTFNEAWKWRITFENGNSQSQFIYQEGPCLGSSTCDVVMTPMKWRSNSNYSTGNVNHSGDFISWVSISEGASQRTSSSQVYLICHSFALFRGKR